jgi:cytochrome c-type biogenesis protein
VAGTRGDFVPINVNFAGAFLAGLASFAAPCMLPLVPAYLCFIAGVSLDQLTHEERSVRTGLAVLAASIFFVLGFASVFMAFGASASFIGRFVLDHLTWLGFAAGLIIIVLGLHFLGVLKIGWLNREARFQVAGRPAGLLGAYLVGLAFGFGWTPCVGPILATILFLAGSEQTALQGALLLLVYAMGIGLPFVLAALFAGPFMRLMVRYRRYIGTVEKVMGGALVVTGVLFITGGIPLMSNMLLEWFPALGRIG